MWLGVRYVWTSEDEMNIEEYNHKLENAKDFNERSAIAEKEVARLRRLIKAIEKVNNKPVLYVEAAREISAEITDIIWHGTEEFTASRHSG